MEHITIPTRPVSLLYVEDDAMTQELIRDSIIRTFPGLEVLTAKSGEEGLDLFRKHAPQIVVTDIMVPGMSGIEMARQIRAISSSALIIAATAYSDSEYLLQAIDLGITHFLLKPLDLHTLLQAIRESISRVKLEQEVKAEKEFIWKLSHVVRQSPSSVLITNSRGTIEYVNSRFSDDTGYGAEEIIGQNLRLIFADARPFDNYEMIWSTITRGFHWRGQLLRRKKNGDFIFEDVCIFPLCSDQGVITHFVAVMDDVSERRLVEGQRVAPMIADLN